MTSCSDIEQRTPGWGCTPHSNERPKGAEHEYRRSGDEIGQAGINLMRPGEIVMSALVKKENRHHRDGERETHSDRRRVGEDIRTLIEGAGERGGEKGRAEEKQIQGRDPP